MVPNLEFATLAIEHLGAQIETLELALREAHGHYTSANRSIPLPLPSPSKTNQSLVLAIYVRCDAQNFLKNYMKALSDELYRLVEEQRRFVMALGLGQSVQNTPGPMLPSKSE